MSALSQREKKVDLIKRWKKVGFNDQNRSKKIHKKNGARSE